MNINQTGFDIIISAVCLAMLILMNMLLFVFKRVPNFSTFRVFTFYSCVTTAFLFILLCCDIRYEYISAYFLVQSFSYLIEMAMCIQLAEMIIKNNWVILLIFGPLLSAIMIVFVIKHSVPKELADFLIPGYVASSLCGFVLFIIWVLQDKFESKLERPYSGIAASIGVFISLRFVIMMANGYYKNSHWGIIGRMYPLNEMLLLILLFVAILPKSNIIEFPTKMTIKDMAAICRDCREEFPNHKNNCRHNKKLRLISAAK